MNNPISQRQNFDEIIFEGFFVGVCLERDLTLPIFRLTKDCKATLSFVIKFVTLKSTKLSVKQQNLSVNFSR